MLDTRKFEIQTFSNGEWTAYSISATPDANQFGSQEEAYAAIAELERVDESFKSATYMVAPIVDAASKARARVEALTAEWLSDRTWDLEDTEGFEEHHDELLIFRLQHELDSVSKRLSRFEACFAAFAALLPGTKAAE